jgi:hypothetical protein
MTETQITEQIRELIDTSAPALSAADIIARASSVESRRAMPAVRSGLRPALVISYSATALVLVVAIVVGLSLGGSGRVKNPPLTTGAKPGSSIAGHGPFADVAATPLGWSPITYRNVQISVPSDWIVYPGGNCPGTDGVVLAVPADLSGCANASSEASIGNFIAPGGDATAVKPFSLKPNTTVNGIPVALEPKTGGSSVEIALGMFVQARGDLSKEILRTLTYAPDFAALNYSAELSWGARVPSPIVPAPSSWQTVTFGGITLRAPRTWSTERDSYWGGCPGNIQASTIRLSAAQTYSTPGCPVAVSDAANWAGVPGVVVGAGPAVLNGAMPATSGDNCVTEYGLKICTEPVPLDAGEEPGLRLNLLTALVFLPGQTRPDQIEIGLSGTGQVVDAIFDSIRPASS